MNEVIGIFADRPDMATGMAVVCRNLALGLSHYPARIIYFGRFGCEVGFSKQTEVHDNILDFDYVPCEGRVWKPKTVIEAVEHYGVDYIFCFLENTLIYSEVPKKISEINVGDRVFTHLGISKKVTKTFCRDYNGEIIGVKSRLGEITWMTPEHPVLTNIRYDRRKQLWKKAKDLAKRNWLFIPYPKTEISPKTIIDLSKYKSKIRGKNSKFEVIIVNRDFCRLVGYYIAEGSSTENGLVSFSLNDNETQYQSEIQSLIKNIFNIEAKTIHVGRGCSAVRFYSKQIGKMLCELCGHGAKNKRFPEWFLNIPNEYLKEIVETYWNGDGWKQYAETASEVLAHQLRLAYLRLGKLVAIYSGQHNGEYFKINVLKQRWGIRKTKLGIWFKITKIIKKQYNGKVYNLKVSKHDSYLANGITVHNCEDDFFSAKGLVTASLKTRKPLHLLTPIDSLPIHPRAYDIFKFCKKVYVPNRSYKLIKNGVFLPHGVDTNLFHPENHSHNENNTFTFLWVGRDEPRKAMGRAIMALEKIYRKVDCKMIIHSDWRADMAKRTARFLRYKRDLPIIMTQMEGGEHSKLRQIYNNADAFICTSKAGGFEMGITEAMACGLPAIVTDWTFMQELIDSICPHMYHSCLIKGCANGLLVPVSNTCEDWVDLGDGRRWGIPLGRKWGNISINALADAMRFMVNNREVVGWMGQKALEKSKKYNWNEIAGKLYKEIIESE